MSKMESIIGHRIDYNWVWVLRGQRPKLDPSAPLESETGYIDWYSLVWNGVQKVAFFESQMGSKFKCLGGTSPPETLVSTPDSPNPPPLREIMLLLVFHCRKRFGNSGPRPRPSSTCSSRWVWSSLFAYSVEFRQYCCWRRWPTSHSAHQ